MPNENDRLLQLNDFNRLILQLYLSSKFTLLSKEFIDSHQQSIEALLKNIEQLFVQKVKQRIATLENHMNAHVSAAEPQLDKSDQNDKAIAYSVYWLAVIYDSCDFPTEARYAIDDLLALQQAMWDPEQFIPAANKHLLTFRDNHCFIEEQDITLELKTLAQVQVLLYLNVNLATFQRHLRSESFNAQWLDTQIAKISTVIDTELNKGKEPRRSAWQQLWFASKKNDPTAHFAYFPTGNAAKKALWTLDYDPAANKDFSRPKKFFLRLLYLARVPLAWDMLVGTERFLADHWELLLHAKAGKRNFSSRAASLFQLILAGVLLLLSPLLATITLVHGIVGLPFYLLFKLPTLMAEKPTYFPATRFIAGVQLLKDFSLLYFLFASLMLTLLPTLLPTLSPFLLTHVVATSLVIMPIISIMGLTLNKIYGQWEAKQMADFVSDIGSPPEIEDEEVDIIYDADAWPEAKMLSDEDIADLGNSGDDVFNALSKPPTPIIHSGPNHHRDAEPAPLPAAAANQPQPQAQRDQQKNTCVIC